MPANNFKARQVEIDWHPGLPIYASEAFLKSVGDEYGWIGGSDCNGELQCVLPFTLIKKPGFRLVRFRTETVPLGRPLELAEEKAFLNSVVDHFRSLSADMIVPSGNAALFRTFPDNSEAAPYGTFVQDLSRSEEELLRGIRK